MLQNYLQVGFTDIKYVQEELDKSGRASSSGVTAVAGLACVRVRTLSRPLTRDLDATLLPLAVTAHGAAA